MGSGPNRGCDDREDQQRRIFDFFNRSAVKGFYARQFLNTENISWLKQQEVNGQQLTVAYFKNGEIVACFDDTTNFTAKIESTDQLADFLLTVMTFKSNPAASSNVPRTGAPGNLILLSGYVHKAIQGIDSRPGTIKNEQGFSIGYDIGRMAGIYAYQYFPEHFAMLRKQTHLNSAAIEREVQYLQDKVVWRQRQKIDGDDVMVVLLKDSTLIASFVKSTANFVAKVDSADKIADFFLMVLTYQPNFNKGN